MFNDCFTKIATPLQLLSPRERNNLPPHSDCQNFSSLKQAWVFEEIIK